MLGRRFEQAILFTIRRHADQKRKGTDVPYVSHLLAVCALVIEAGGGEDDAIAALLHDTVEDQKATFEEIRTLFGDAVAGVVKECSDTDQDPKPPWRERKERFLETLAGLSPSARLVVAADKLHNARSTLAELEVRGDSVWSKFNGGRDGTLWYFRGVARGLGDGTPLTRALVDTVARLETAAARVDR